MTEGFSSKCSIVERERGGDRKSTRLNSSHLVISYAVFCLKKTKAPAGGAAHGHERPPRAGLRGDPARCAERQAAVDGSARTGKLPRRPPAAPARGRRSRCGAKIGRASCRERV